MKNNIKKLLVLSLLLSLSLTIQGCTKDDSSKGTVEKEVKHFDEDGSLNIKILTEDTKELVETIDVKYEGEYVTRVEYTIYEKDVDVLNQDKAALIDLVPSHITTSDDLVLNAVYESEDLAGDNISFEKFNKRNISEYIDTLKGMYEGYTFEFVYDNVDIKE